MANVTMILAQSGSGKSTSIRNLDPKDTMVIKVVDKPFPFRSKSWKKFDKKTKEGSYIVTDDYAVINSVFNKIGEINKKIIVIDDSQYLMSNEFMKRSSEKGFDKFTEIGKKYWEMLRNASNLPEDIRVYILSHTEEKDGKTKIKTIGNLLDDKITLEGLVTIVLGCGVENGKHFFTTQNNGSNTEKSPIGMFEEYRIDNDLKIVDDAICEYYDIGKKEIDDS